MIVIKFVCKFKNFSHLERGRPNCWTFLPWKIECLCTLFKLGWFVTALTNRVGGRWQLLGLGHKRQCGFPLGRGSHHVRSLIIQRPPLQCGHWATWNAHKRHPDHSSPVFKISKPKHRHRREEASRWFQPPAVKAPLPLSVSIWGSRHHRDKPALLCHVQIPDPQNPHA